MAGIMCVSMWNGVCDILKFYCLILRAKAKHMQIDNLLKKKSLIISVKIYQLLNQCPALISLRNQWARHVNITFEFANLDYLSTRYIIIAHNINDNSNNYDNNNNIARFIIPTCRFYRFNNWVQSISLIHQSNFTDSQWKTYSCCHQWIVTANQWPFTDSG